MESVQQFLSGQLDALREVSGELGGSAHPQWSFFLFIFFNNSIKSVLVIYLGALFGVMPVIFLVINGALLGYLIHVSSLQGQDIADLIIKGLLPHGIVEIPALLIACAYGLKFGGRLLALLLKSGRREKDSMSTFLRQTVTGAFWVVLMLLFAAIIESTITFALVS